MSFNKETGMYEGYLYVIKNEINNHKYVGQTLRTPKKRWYEHRQEARLKRSNCALYRAFRKYGINNFSFKIIEKITNASKEQLKNILDEKEIFYIKHYNTHSKTGYNSTDGGDNICDDNKCSIEIDVYNKHGVFIEEICGMNNAARKYGIAVSNISECCNGNIGYAKDYVFRLKGQPFDMYLIDRQRKMRIYQYTTDGDLVAVYNSMIEAARVLNINHSNICVALDKKDRTSGGFVWSTTDTFPGYTKKDKINMYDKDDRYIKTYKALKDVVEDGFSLTGVNGACKKRIILHKNHKFFYSSDPEQPDKTKIIPTITTKEVS